MGRRRGQWTRSGADSMIHSRSAKGQWLRSVIFYVALEASGVFRPVVGVLGSVGLHFENKDSNMSTAESLFRYFGQCMARLQLIREEPSHLYGLGTAWLTVTPRSGAQAGNIGSNLKNLVPTQKKYTAKIGWRGTQTLKDMILIYVWLNCFSVSCLILQFAVDERFRLTAWASPTSFTNDLDDHQNALWSWQGTRPRFSALQCAVYIRNPDQRVTSPWTTCHEIWDNPSRQEGLGDHKPNCSLLMLSQTMLS